MNTTQLTHNADMHSSMAVFTTMDEASSTWGGDQSLLITNLTVYIPLIRPLLLKGWGEKLVLKQPDSMQDKYFFIELCVCTLVSLSCTEVCWHSFITKHVGTTGQSTIFGVPVPSYQTLRGLSLVTNYQSRAVWLIRCKTARNTVSHPVKNEHKRKCHR